MEWKCYHCEHASDNGTFVTFYNINEEHDEFLCRNCYSEWLASIKE